MVMFKLRTYLDYHFKVLGSIRLATFNPHTCFFSYLILSKRMGKCHIPIAGQARVIS